jgi:hypothetical protein
LTITCRKKAEKYPASRRPTPAEAGHVAALATETSFSGFHRVLQGFFASKLAKQRQSDQKWLTKSLLFNICFQLFSLPS